MMEFTFDGIVRQGFGFYNPNHAAALICALMPFLWQWRRLAWVGWSLATILAFCLALTYSRTGMLVLGIELVCYFILTKIKNWKLIVGIIAVLAVIMLTTGIFSRFALDKAVTNRPEIWLAGVQLVAHNPYFGVGLGNSGMLASTFLLDGIHCRTLINSHLTLFAEFGVFIGIIWCCFVGYAILRGIKKITPWCAFVGLNLSAFAATIFDWGLLFDFANTGGLSLLNFVMSWLLFTGFLILGIYLSWEKFNIKYALGVLTGVLMILLVSIFGFRNDKTPSIKGNFIIKQGENMALILYDQNWTLKTILPHLESGYILPLKAKKHQLNAKNVWLFGQAIDYASDYPSSKLILVSPPEFFEMPKNVEKIYIKRFGDKPNTHVEIEYY